MTDTTPPEDLHDLAHPFALDALSDADRDAIENWLDGNEDATAITFRATVRQLRETLAAMTVVDAAPAPPRLEAAIMQAIDEYTTEQTDTAPPTGRTWSARWLAAAAAALIAIAAGTGIALWYNQTPNSGNVTAEQVDRHDDARMHTVLMTGGGAVTVDTSWQLGAATVIFDSAPTPPQGHVYQLWRISEAGQPSSAGVLTPLPSTDAPLVVRLDNAYKLAVSIEPDGGSQQPTHPVAAIPLQW
jgi:anti-sigma-K factor RskA